MTTVAYDGTTIASDSLATDAWGLASKVPDKIKLGKDFVAGTAGERGQIMRWWRKVSGLSFAELEARGFEDYHKDDNDPAIMLIHEGRIYRHISGIFLPEARPFFAIGSGRDYALMAMRLGKTAVEAVALACEFDNSSGGPVVGVRP